MVTIKLNGKPVDFPTCAADLTLKQFFELRKATSPIEEVCALTGLDKNTVSNFKSMDTITNAQALMKTIADDIQNWKAPNELPDKIFLKGKFFDVPKKLELQPVGAWMNVHDLLAAEDQENTKSGLELKNYTNCVIPTLAHYFYAVCNKGHDYSEAAVEAPEWQEAIMSLRINVAFPIANYFFLKFPDLP